MLDAKCSHINTHSKQRKWLAAFWCNVGANGEMLLMLHLLPNGCCLQLPIESRHRVSQRELNMWHAKCVQTPEVIRANSIRFDSTQFNTIQYNSIQSILITNQIHITIVANGSTRCSQNWQWLWVANRTHIRMNFIYFHHIVTTLSLFKRKTLDILPFHAKHLIHKKEMHLPCNYKSIM